MSITSVQKAFILVYLNKAEVVEASNGRQLRSVSQAFPFPSIVRLNRYKRIPFKEIILSRKNILRRDGHRCQYCSTTRAPITVDHVKPKCQGGPDTWENLVAACIRCNNRKGNRTPEQAGMKLLSIPRRPSHISFIVHAMNGVQSTWRPYLFMR
ncbi:MAG: HNH endonuclease [Ectothiorhodospiraceae bacterium]|nr:HNH endonuclease [Ectothiorhodospiraceae bacterium]